MPSTIIKHNDRSLRHACKVCGKGGLADDSVKLYWGHDTSRPGYDFCKKCSTDGKWVLVHADGSLHDCKTDGPGLPPDMTGQSAPVAPSATGGNDVAGQIADLLTKLAPTVDMTQVVSEVNRVVNERMAEVITAVEAMTMPVTVKIVKHDAPAVTVSNAHKMLPKVLAVLTAPGVRKHVMLVGPAGSGKSTLAKHVAESLFGSADKLYEIALGPTMAESRVIGYRNASGDYVETFVRQWAEGGGVLHLDEFDAGNAGVLTVFNSLLSNGHFGFPDKMIPLHPECYVVASLNTYGRGADRTYKGRQALDEATLNRFVKIPVYYDDAVEQGLCLATGMDLARVTQVLTYVRALRSKAESERLPIIMGVRESEGLCSLIMAGLTESEAIEWRIRGGITDTDWTRLNTDVKPFALS